MTTTHFWQTFRLSALGLILLLLLAACAGVGSNGTINSITGTIAGVDAAHHSITLNVNGQTYTISGLSDQELQSLQSQVGKPYTVHVTQNSDGSFALTIGTNPTLANNETPGVNEGPEPGETPGSGETPGASGRAESISFTGALQQSSKSSLTASLPDGSSLTMAINAQTDLSGLNGAQLHSGQSVKIDALASASGFVAEKIKLADAGEQNDAHTVDFQGHATQAVGSDHLLHFSVGNRAFSYALGSNADLSDFGGNVGAITSGAVVKVKVVFNGTTGSVINVSKADS
jgi:hypothetical protein